MLQSYIAIGSKVLRDRDVIAAQRLFQLVAGLRSPISIRSSLDCVVRGAAPLRGSANRTRKHGGVPSGTTRLGANPHKTAPSEGLCCAPAGFSR